MPYVYTFSNAILDALLGTSATLLGTPVELGLSTTEPNTSGGNITEPAGNGYARLSVPNNGANWGAAVDGEKVNVLDLSFPAASGGSWGTLTHWVMWYSGVPKLWGVLDDGAGVPTPRTISDTDIFRWLAGRLRIKQV